MKLNEVLSKMPEGRKLKRKSSEQWLVVYQDGTLRPAGGGKGPKKPALLTTTDYLADDWHYEVNKMHVCREDLIDVAKAVFSSNPGKARTLSPAEIINAVAEEMGME